MNTHSPDERWLTVSIPIGAFTARLKQLMQTTARTGSSMHSRLSLIHQTAKLYATEAAQQAGAPNPVVDIDELTNPPLLDLPIDEADEQQVIVRFSYQSDVPTVSSKE